MLKVIFSSWQKTARIILQRPAIAVVGFIDSVTALFVQRTAIAVFSCMFRRSTRSWSVADAWAGFARLRVCRLPLPLLPTATPYFLLLTIFHLLIYHLLATSRHGFLFRHSSSGPGTGYWQPINNRRNLFKSTWRDDEITKTSLAFWKTFKHAPQHPPRIAKRWVLVAAQEFSAVMSSAEDRQSLPSCRQEDPWQHRVLVSREWDFA